MKTSIKRIAALLLALVVMIPVGVIGVFADTATTNEAITPTTGWKANEDGVFEISSAADFYAFASLRTSFSNYKDQTVILTADIDLNPGWDASTKTEPTNKWASAFYMDGTFDGQGHTIKGIYINVNENANLFVLAQNGSTIKNLKIENSYFHAKKNSAGVFAAARGPKPLTFENVYIDAIVECDDGTAGGFVSWFNATTNNSLIPSVIMNNCVFAGSVSAGKAAAAFVGTNDKPSGNKGGGMYSVTLTDCVNYGSVTSATADMAAAFVGNCANEATLTRCYNAGTVATAFVNVGLSTETNESGAAVNVTLVDCYYLATASTKATTKTTAATATITMKYDGAAATEAKTATVAELVNKNAFKASGDYKGWVLTKDSKSALPFMITCIVDGHAYGTPVVTAPTCQSVGYSTYTCSKCAYTYEGDLVPAADHIEGDEWIVDREATEDFSGLRHKVCTVCGTEMTKEVIQQLESTTTAPADDETTAPEETTATEETTAAGEDKKGGCGASIALTSALSMSAMIALGAVVACKKRK